MNKTNQLYCLWADSGLALHNSGRALLCCHSRNYLKDDAGKDIYWHSHSLQDAWQSQTRQEIQQALEQGVRHSNCQACWDEEDAGRPSRRMEHNRINHDIMASQTSPRVLDLKLGNTCNLACRHCWPEVSSKWINEYYEISVKPTGVSRDQYLRQWDSIQLSYNRDNDRLWNDLRDWMPAVEYIDIFGAEPMLLSRLWEILERCVHTGSSVRQALHINTNATIWNPNYIDTLTRFKSVQLDLSIDGIGDHFEYIRHGETWSHTESNIEQFVALPRQHENISVAVCITVCTLNIWYVADMLEYFQKRNISVFINLVHLPEYLNIRCLPNPVKDAIVQHLDRPRAVNQFAQGLIQQLKNFINLEHPDAQRHWQQFCHKTTKIDHLRDQDFASTFPEMYQQLKPYWTPITTLTNPLAVSP